MLIIGCLNRRTRTAILGEVSVSFATTSTDKIGLNFVEDVSDDQDKPLALAVLSLTRYLATYGGLLSSSCRRLQPSAESEWPLGPKRDFAGRTNGQTDNGLDKGLFT